MRTQTTTIRLGWLFLLALTLTACGFQPRGQAIAPASAITPLALAGIDADHPLYIAIQKRLAPGTLVADPGQARAVVTISKVQSRGELLTVDARNKSSELELTESFDYSIRSGERESVPEQLSAQRIHYAPGDAVLARAREADTLREHMYAELADRLVRRLAAWQ